MCGTHLHMFHQRHYMPLIARIMQSHTMDEASDLIEDAIAADEIGPREEHDAYRWAMHWFQELEEFEPPAVLANMAPLQRLAHDNQNVHTAEINAQTKRGMDVLLNLDIPAHQSTLAEVKARAKDRTYYDAAGWYGVPMYVNEIEDLYKHLLDGCVAYINASSHKEELWSRLCQEMDESVGKCCMGHITRLCNTFVGFDDRFAPPLPVGELLQQKMAVIAAKDIETYLKVQEANAVFEELHVPEDQREAWLEAF